MTGTKTKVFISRDFVNNIPRRMGGAGSFAKGHNSLQIARCHARFMSQVLNSTAPSG